MGSAENTEEHLVKRNVKYLMLTRVPEVSMRLMEVSEKIKLQNKDTRT